MRTRRRHTLIPLATAIAAGALALAGAAPAAAAPAPQETTLASSFTGCAYLKANYEGKATVKNVCAYAIHATVSVDWGWDPDCQKIGPGRTATFKWDSTKGKALEAYVC
ncbi:hypothetical protein [Streptomyces sp. A1499]|uniref:hypothetical protein n=1 Tax=Streptomyces sp. A1499 TaxID=2563104 RepID=UPI00109E5C23|nr:hypothetical protein [Streptomyces sp. A1499]THC43157.1 hypothetical protein E7X58_35340 [Streptomyces sp. A1499]